MTANGSACGTPVIGGTRGELSSCRLRAAPCEECGDLGEEEDRQCDVGDEAAAQDRRVVDAEGEGVAKVSDRGYQAAHQAQRWRRRNGMTKSTMNKKAKVSLCRAYPRSSNVTQRATPGAVALVWVKLVPVSSK